MGIGCCGCCGIVGWGGGGGGGESVWMKMECVGAAGEALKSRIA